MSILAKLFGSKSKVPANPISYTGFWIAHCNKPEKMTSALHEQIEDWFYLSNHGEYQGMIARPDSFFENVCKYAGLNFSVLPDVPTNRQEFERKVRHGSSSNRGIFCLDIFGLRKMTNGDFNIVLFHTRDAFGATGDLIFLLRKTADISQLQYDKFEDVLRFETE